MSFPLVELEVDDLAKILYDVNKTDTVIELSLGGIEDNKDLFYFCLDLFCKGLVMLFGEDNKLIVNTISIDQFEIIKRKLHNAGINVTLTLFTPEPISHEDYDVPDLPTSCLYPNINIEDIEIMPNNLPLNDYKFEIKLSPEIAYKISFELFHKVV